MATRPKGSTFNIGDQGVFYNALDMGCSLAASAADNRTALIAAFGTLTSSGGVILVPHGVDHNFVSADFPVTTEALCLWEMKGDSFKLITNLTHETDLGEILKTLKIEEPQLIKLKLVDTLSTPATYTFTMEVYDDAGSPTIAGSSFDVCFFVPGVATPVEAIARSGAVPGRHYFFKGIDVTGTSNFDGDVTFEQDVVVTGDVAVTGDVSAHELSGIKLFNMTVQVPTPAGTYNAASTDESIIFDHSGTVASFTLNLPTGVKTGHRILGWSRSALTSFTVAATGGDSIAAGHGITALSAGQGWGYMYRASDLKWYRVQ
jgi:hypothetical protein